MTTNNLLILILLFLVLTLIVALVALVVFVFKNPRPPSKPEVQHYTDPVEVMKQIFEENKKKDKKILGLCNVCEVDLYEGDHFEVDHLHLCRDHLKSYSSNEWVAITNQKTTSETPEAGIYIYNFKQDLWNNEQEPCYIQCEYKIDIINDLIETYVLLYVRKEKSDEFKLRLDKEKVSNE